MARRRRAGRLKRLALLVLGLYAAFKAVSFGLSTVALEARIAGAAAEWTGGSVEIGLADSDFWRNARIFRARITRDGAPVLKVARLLAAAERPFLLGDPGRIAWNADGVTLDLDAARALCGASGPPDPALLSRIAARLGDVTVENFGLSATLPELGLVKADGMRLSGRAAPDGALLVELAGARFGPLAGTFAAGARVVADRIEFALDAPGLLARTGSPLRLGPCAFEGTLAVGFEAVARFPLDAARLEGALALRFSDASLSVDLARDPLRVEGASGSFLANTGAPSRLELSGTLPALRGARLSAAGELSADLSRATAEGRLASPLLALFPGAAGLSPRFRLVRDADGATLTLDLGDPGTAVAASCRLSVNREGIRLEDGLFRAGGANARFEGRGSAATGLSLKIGASGIDLPALAALLPLPTGAPRIEAGRLERCDLDLAAAPPAAEPGAARREGAFPDLSWLARIDPRSLVPSGKVKIAGLKAEGIALDELECGFRVEGDAVRLEDARVRPAGSAPLRVEGRFFPGAPFRGEFTLKEYALDPAALARAGVKAAGKVTLEGTLRADGPALRFEGRAHAAKASLQGVPLPATAPLVAELSLAGGAARLVRLSAGPAAGASFTLAAEGEGYAVTATLPELDPAPWLDAKTAARAGKIRDLKIEGALGPGFAPRSGTLSAADFTLRHEGVAIQVAAPRVRFEGGKLVARDLAAKVGGVPVTLSFEHHPREGGSELTLAGRGIDPAPFLAGTLAGLKIEGGKVDLSVRYSMKKGGSSLRGDATVAASRVDLPGMREPLRDLRCSFATEGDALAVREGTFRTGGAAWIVRGAVRAGADGTPRLDLAIENGTATLELPGVLKAKGAARLTLTGPLSAPRIGGQVRADEGVLTLPKDLGAGIALDVSPVELDVAVRAEKRFWVRADYLNAELAGDLRIRTRKGIPRFVGELETTRGTFLVYGNEFRIEEGKLRFPESDSLVPHLYLRATGRAGAYTVTVDASGAVDTLALTLTSSPPLAQDEIVALLATGDPKGEVGGSGAPLQAGGALVVDYTKGQVLGGIKRSLRDTLGLDDLSFDAGTKGGDRRGSNLRVGKYMSDKVYVQYTLEKSEELRKQESLDLDFKLDKKVDFTIRNDTERGSSFGVKVKNKF